MGQTIAVALGGSLGAVARYWTSIWLARWLGSAMPWATLSVNFVGSLLMGLLFVVITEKFNLSDQWRLILMVGFLGSLTTFSTFSLETVSLMQHGRLVAAVVYVIISVVACVFGCLVSFNLATRYF